MKVGKDWGTCSTNCHQNEIKQTEKKKRSHGKKRRINYIKSSKTGLTYRDF